MPGAVAVVAQAVASTAAIVLTSKAAPLLLSWGLSGALKKKPKTPDSSVGPVSRSQMVRKTDTVREYVYGRQKKAGTLLFHYTTQDNRYFYMVIAVASHAIEEYEKMWIDEEELTISTDLDSDTTYSSTGITHKVAADSTVFKDTSTYLWADFSYGSTSTGVNKRFQNEINQDAGETIISNTDYFRGISCCYLKLRWSTVLFNGVPNVQFLIKGKNDVLDTRDSTPKYTTNSALCLYDYLTDTLIGLGADTAEIDTTAVNTAANVCDESVSLNGGGTESRYTCNGTIDSSARVEDGIESILSSMAGQLVYVNGTFRMLAGAYQTPTITLTEDDFLEVVSITRPGRKDKFNAVRGVYINEDEDWKPTDFPHVTNSTYQTEDGERIYKDLEMPFTISGATAQRLALIDLEKIRQDVIVECVISPQQWNIAAGDNIMITYSPLGWTSKVFEVQERGFSTTQDRQGNLLFGIRLKLRETASSVYTWSSNETAIDPAPNTNLPSPTKTSAVASITLSSDETHLIRGKNGRIVTRIKVSWPVHDDAFVTEGGKIQIFAKKSTDSSYELVSEVDGAQTFGYVTDVDDREQYDVRVRVVNAFNSKSAYVTETGHTVIGKTTPPPKVTGFEAAAIVGNVRFSWDKLDILDVYGYEIRYGQTGIQWKDATPLTKAKQGTHEISAAVPPGSWVFLIKAVDYVGLYSNVASVAGEITVGNANTVLNAIDDGLFPGTLDNFVLHYTGVLTPDDQFLASYYDFEVFDYFVPTPQQICTYTSSEIDLGSDQDVRVWGDIESRLGPGVTVGTADPQLQICYRAAADSASGGDVTTNLITSSGTFTNCILHYTGKITPDSQSLASAADFEIFNEFVYDPYETCSYEAPEQDLGADGNVMMDIQNGQALGPGESGTPESTIRFDSKTSAGSYDGFEDFTFGTFNLRYYKARIEWNNLSNVTYIDSLQTEIGCWRDWIIGDISGVRYVQARIKLDTNVGNAKITDFNWTIDQ